VRPSLLHDELHAGYVVALFGGKKVGELGKGLGEGIRNFKTALKEEEKKPKKRRSRNRLREQPASGAGSSSASGYI
jgi:sec-independent protein translocase protein TatA